MKSSKVVHFSKALRDCAMTVSLPFPDFPKPYSEVDTVHILQVRIFITKKSEFPIISPSKAYNGS